MLRAMHRVFSALFFVCLIAQASSLLQGHIVSAIVLGVGAACCGLTYVVLRINNGSL
jgi:hypothetical protein